MWIEARIHTKACKRLMEHGMQVLEGALAGTKAKLEAAEERVEALEGQVASLERKEAPEEGGGQVEAEEMAALRSRIAELETQLAAREAENGGVQEVSRRKPLSSVDFGK